MERDEEDRLGWPRLWGVVGAERPRDPNALPNGSCVIHPTSAPVLGTHQARFPVATVAAIAAAPATVPVPATTTVAATVTAIAEANQANLEAARRKAARAKAKTQRLEAEIAAAKKEEAEASQAVENSKRRAVRATATPLLRFAVDDLVRCKTSPTQEGWQKGQTRWRRGHVVQLNYREDMWPAGRVAAYRVELQELPRFEVEEPPNGELEQPTRVEEPPRKVITVFEDRADLIRAESEFREQLTKESLLIESGT